MNKSLYHTLQPKDSCGIIMNVCLIVLSVLFHLVDFCLYLSLE